MMNLQLRGREKVVALTATLNLYFVKGVWTELLYYSISSNKVRGLLSVLFLWVCGLFCYPRGKLKY